MLSFLENTSVAIWVGESFYAYPALLACHIVGLATVVGIYAMRDFKLMGLFPDVDTEAFIVLNRLAFAGFAINAVSGFLLFSSQASYLATSVPFLSKLSCIAVAMTLAVIIQRRLKSALIAGTDSSAASDGQLRLMAAASLASWTGAIIAGRLIAYIF